MTVAMASGTTIEMAAAMESAAAMTVMASGTTMEMAAAMASLRWQR